MADQHRLPAAVVMVPLPAQGHLNQLLHLSRLIASRNIPVHYAASAAHIRQAKTRVHGWDPSSAAAAVHFHELPTPPYTNPPPNPNAATKFPTQIIPSLLSSMQLRQPVFELVQKLAADTRRLAVVYDSSLPYVVQDIPLVPNAEAYCFHSIAAFSIYSFIWEYGGKPPLPKELHIFEQVPTVDGCFPPEYDQVMKFNYESPKVNSGDIYNTSRVIEHDFIDLLAKEKSTGTDKIWAVGPFNPVSIQSSSDGRSECLKWLDKQGLNNSVIFVSFGSTCSLTDEQISEIAIGLERSGQKFIWVIRDGDRGNIFEGDSRRAPLPQGYEERIQGRGLVLRDWAPQLEILGHASIGGFMTHCGWNSSMESISMGVPVAAWPMHSDQPRNAVLMIKVLGIGVEVREWGRRDEIVPSERVESVVRRLMASGEGEEIRKRAAELGSAVRKSVIKGGVSDQEMDSFIAHITRAGNESS